MYLTYETYQDMGGTLDEATFLDFEFEAESTIDWYTFNRLRNETEISDRVQRLMYRLIYIGYLRRQSMAVGQDVDGQSMVSGAISSQSNDGYSTSFNVLSASQALQISSREIKLLVTRYLQGETNSLGHKLLYRGIYPDE